MSSRLLENLGNKADNPLSPTCKNIFNTYEKGHHTPVDLTAQVIHLRAGVQADIIKKKLQEGSGGLTAVNFSKSETKYMICYMGRAGLINSGEDLEGMPTRQKQ